MHLMTQINLFRMRRDNERRPEWFDKCFLPFIGFVFVYVVLQVFPMVGDMLIDIGCLFEGSMYCLSRSLKHESTV